MKKTLCIVLAFCILFSFSACRKKKNQTQETQAGTQAVIPQETQSTPPEINQVVEDKTMVAVSVPAETTNTVHKNGTVLFQLTQQHISLTLNKPDVADKIILDFLTRIDNTMESADSIMAMAKNAYNAQKDWMPYLYSILYSPTRIDHNVLSFSGSIEEYTGGPHPNRSRTSVSYDLQTGDVLTLASIMHKDASVSTICDLVLVGLAELSANTDLYEGYEYTIRQRFAGDASINEDWYFTQTGLCFAFSPYEIAPYSSGVITVEIPYEKLKTILHEDYLPVARNIPQGTVQFTSIDNIDTNNPREFAELVVNQGGKMLIAQTDNYVQDLRIRISNEATTYTIFAAYALYQGDGITIQVDDETRGKMELTYKTANQTVTTPIG